MTLLCFFRRKNMCDGGFGFEREHLFLPVESIKFDGSTKLIAISVPGNDESTITGIDSPNFIANLGNNTVSLSVEGSIQDIPNQEIYEWFPTDEQPVGYSGPVPLRVANVAYRPQAGDQAFGVPQPTPATPGTGMVGGYPGDPTNPGFTSPTLQSDNPSVIQAESLRDAITNFFASQGSYEEIEFGWPAWIRVQSTSTSQSRSIANASGLEDSINFLNYYNPDNGLSTDDEAPRKAVDPSIKLFQTIQCNTDESSECDTSAYIIYRIWRGNIERLSFSEEAGAPSQYPFSVSFKVGSS